MPGPNGTRPGRHADRGAAARGPAGGRMSMARGRRQAGPDKGFVSKLERDLANVSVASLIRLCDRWASRSARCPGTQGRGGPARRPAADQLAAEDDEYLLTPAGEKRGADPS